MPAMTAAHAMPMPHHPHWPSGLPLHLTLPETNLFHNAEVSARRYPNKPYLLYYGASLSFAEFHNEATRLAGYLENVCGVKAGDRVLLYLQNSPQWILGYYAILRANAVVVPVNPMNRSDELAHYVADSGARVAIAAQDLLPQLRDHLNPAEHTEPALHHVVVACYRDHLPSEAQEKANPTGLRLPDSSSSPSRIRMHLNPLTQPFSSPSTSTGAVRNSNLISSSSP